AGSPLRGDPEARIAPHPGGGGGGAPAAFARRAASGHYGGGQPASPAEPGGGGRRRVVDRRPGRGSDAGDRGRAGPPRVGRAAHSARVVGSPAGRSGTDRADPAR